MKGMSFEQKMTATICVVLRARSECHLALRLRKTVNSGAWPNSQMSTCLLHEQGVQLRVLYIAALHASSCRLSLARLKLRSQFKMIARALVGSGTIPPACPAIRPETPHLRASAIACRPKIRA